MRPKAPALAGCLFLAVALLLPAAASAQIDTGSIVGTVTDSSSGVVPGATVMAIQEGTRFTFTAATNSKGQFVFPNLRIGTYTVSAEAQGFKKAVRQGIQLHVQERLEADLSLDLR